MMCVTFQQLQSYMAPGMLEENDDVGIYDLPVDLWATGVMADEMITRTTPYGSVSISLITTLDKVQWDESSPV